jgi:hypothetical protein
MKKEGILKRTAKALKEIVFEKYAFLIAISFILGLMLVFSSCSALAYNWDFSTPSDYIYNATEIIVTGGNAQLNGTSNTPYSWWHLNENTGTNITDSSGNNRNGVAMANPSWVAGKLNSALQFNGASNYVDFGNSTGNFERTQAFSVELWFKTANTGQQIFLSKMKSTENYEGWEIYFDGTSTNRIVFDLKSNIASTNMIRVYCSPSVVADNNWHHLVVTYDGSSNATGVKFYFDGSLKTNGIIYNTLTASILTSTAFQLSGRGNGALGIAGLLDEVIIYDGVLSSTKVISRYNSGNGIESPVGDYPLGYYTIQTKNNFTLLSNLMNFNETAIKTGSAIKYSVTTDGTDWKFWNSSVWSISNGSWTQSSPASDINSHISTLGSSGNFSFKAVLHSNEGIYTPYLDNIEVLECSENWVANYTSCGTNLNASCSGYDNKTKIYYDSNSCGSTSSLPADNGTCISCDYCLPSWYCEIFDNCAGYWKDCLFVNTTLPSFNSCCLMTGYSSDCTYTGSLALYKAPCGDILAIMSVNQYPYIDCNTTYNIEVIATINGSRLQFNNMYIDLDGITYNMTWDNSSQSYKTSFIFQYGDYPFSIWEDYPDGVMQNITGTFIVRCPFFVTIEGYIIKPKNQTNQFINTNTYAFAEFENQVKKQQLGGRSPYDTTLEQYLTPLDFKRLFKTKVFHTTYTGNSATFKLWEANRTYAFRLVDGQMFFHEGAYSQMNMSKSFGTNLYLGTLYLTGANETYQVFLTQQELHPYTTLFNWLWFIGVLIILISGIAITFMGFPQVAYYFAIFLFFALTILRIIIWIGVG